MRCGGANHECLLCAGTGEVKVLTCPRKVARGTETFMQSYVDWIGDAKMLPAQGTMRDQSAAWVKGVRIADSERGALEAEKSRKNAAVGGKQN